MRISFVVNKVFDGWNAESTRLGGSEECVVEWAKCLSKNHPVKVFHNGKHGKFGRVKYLPYSMFEPGDITINVNYPEFAPQGKTIYYTSLTENPDTSQFDAVCCLSQYAKDNTNLPKRSIIVSPGYSKEIYPGKKIPKQCFYASSPDRGLDTLLEAWPRIVRAHPDATLLVTYGGKLDIPGVINLGEVDEKTMNDVYRTSDIWCHPNPTHELFCITGKKAQVSGCIPVITPAWALSETVRRGFKTTPEDYAKTLIEVLGMDMKFRDIIRQEVIREANVVTWEQSTEKLLQVIESVL